MYFDQNITVRLVNEQKMEEDSRQVRLSPLHCPLAVNVLYAPPLSILYALRYFVLERAPAAAPVEGARVDTDPVDPPHPRQHLDGLTRRLHLSRRHRPSSSNPPFAGPDRVVYAGGEHSACLGAAGAIDGADRSCMWMEAVGAWCGRTRTWSEALRCRRTLR